MNKVEETNDGNIYIDGVKINNIKSIKRFFDLSGCGVEISFYTRNYISPNSIKSHLKNDIFEYMGRRMAQTKMTKEQAEKAIMRILKQYEADNDKVVDNVYIDEKDLSNYGDKTQKFYAV